VNDQDEREAGPATAEARAEWTRPEVDRLVAGAAEGSADISTDGIDIPS
jgi:hypothetical protein